jgi:hypothetical protein
MNEVNELYSICQEFKARVANLIDHERAALDAKDLDGYRKLSTARDVWLDAWQIVIDHMWAIVRSGEKDVAQ